MVEKGGFFWVKKLVNERIRERERGGGEGGGFKVGEGMDGKEDYGGSGRGLPFVEGVWFGDGDGKCGLV